MLRTIQKMLNSHQRCSDSSIFCINAKTCTFRYLDEFSQANQIQLIITGVLSDWHFQFYPHSHRTLFLVVADATGAGGKVGSAEREPVGHPWQYKFENNDGYAGKEFSYINILDYGRLMFGTFREGASMCVDIKCLRGFRYDVQAS